MMRLMEAPRDVQMLGRVLPAYIEYAANAADSALNRRNEIRRQIAMNPERLERMNPLPEIPFAFEIWIGHLSWLDLISDGVQLGPDFLEPEEVEGLALYRRARERFWAEHSCCPVCNSVNLRTAKFCAGCGKSFA